MRKTCFICIICLIVLSLCACSKKEDTVTPTLEPTSNEEVKPKEDEKPTEEIKPTEEVKPTEEATPTEEITPTEEEVPTEEVTPTEEEVPTEEVTPTEEVVPTDEVTPTEGILPTDEPIPTGGTEVSELPDMNVVFKDYYEYVRSCMDEEFTKMETMRYGLAFIDGDLLPELLVVDNNYHGTGVRVIFYNNGDPKEVGAYGSNGGFAYVKNENRLISFFMNNGIRTESVSHINPDYTDMVDLDFWADDNGDGGYKINGESVSVDLFDEMIEKATKSEKGNKCLIVNYEDMLPYYPYVCDPDLIDAFDMMYRELLDPDYEKFSGYYNDNMRKLEGNWSLIRSEVHAKDTNFEYDSKTAENGKGYETLSALTFSKENGAGMWLSTYKDGNSVDDLTITSYAMPYTYMNSGISEGLDFGWSVKLDPEFSDWEFYMCMDDEDHLILALFKDSGYVDGDYHPIYYTVVLTYERGTDPEDL